MGFASKAPKPIGDYQKHFGRLRCFWLAWVFLRLLVLPSVMARVYGVGFFAAVLWQGVLLLPALVFLPLLFGSRQKSAYMWIIFALTAVVYWAVAATFCLIYGYQKNALLAILAGGETALLLGAFWCVFLGLKKMPPAHKSEKNQSRAEE